MADRALGGLYVDILTKGMQNVQRDIDKIKSDVAAASEKHVVVTADTSKAMKATTAFAAELQQTLSNTPLTLKLGLDQSRAGLITQVKADLDKLPSTKRVAFVAEKLDAVNAQIRQLQEELRKTPDSKEVRVKLEYAKAVKADLGKEQAAVAAPKMPNLSGMFGGMEAAASKAGEALAKVGEAAAKVGTTAAASFAVGSASIAGFIRAADPVGVERLQGTMGAIAVQLGSIFLPILDSVHAGLEKLLGILRNLDNTQKDQIVSWVKIAGAIALGLAVLPKVVSLISLATGAMKLFGVTSALATGGLTAVLGILAAAVTSFALFGDKTEEGGSALSKLADLVKPLLDAFKSVGTALLDAVQPVLPLLVDLGKTVIEALTPVIALVAEVAKELGGVLADTIKAVVPIIKDSLTIVLEAFKRVVEAVRPLIAPLADIFKSIVSIVADVMAKLQPVFEQGIGLVVSVIEKLMPVVQQVVETVGQMLESLAPVIGTLAESFATSISLMLKLAGALLAGLEPVFGAVSDYVAQFGDIFAAVMDTISPLLEAFTEAVRELEPLFDQVFSVITDALQALAPVFTATFDVILKSIMGLVKALIFVATLMKEISKGNFRGAMSEARKAVEEFDQRVEDKKQQREQKRADRQSREQEEPEDTEEKEKTAGRHAPTAAPKVELIGFAELWRKAQTAAVETPEQKKQQERDRDAQETLAENKRHTRLLEEIRDKEDDGMPSTFAM